MSTTRPTRHIPPTKIQQVTMREQIITLEIESMCAKLTLLTQTAMRL